MKILVTGAKGLLGHELCEQLSLQGHEVLGLDNGFRGRSWPKCAHYVEFDLATDDFANLPHDLDMIYHFGAMNGTNLFYSMPNRLLTNNLRCDLNVFDWAGSQKKLRNVVYASSSEVISGHNADCVAEIKNVCIDDIHNARWSYRLAKICAENYLANSDLPWTVIRYFNVYGSRSFQGHFVYDIVQKIKQRSFEIIGPEETRCYCHVEDAVQATIRVAEHTGHIINVGSDQEIDALSAATIVANAMGYRDISWRLLPGRPGSAARRRPDITLLKSFYPEFCPRLFAQGIKQVLPSL